MSRRGRFLVAALSVWLMASTTWAADAPSASVDPALEKQVMKIAEELRCLVCQNQTIADSHAELAVDLKNQVREMLLKGKSENEIKSYMVDRYGDFVLYRPPVKGNTWLLWVGPFVLLLGGLLFAVHKLRLRSKKLSAVDAELTPENRDRLQRLLAENLPSTSDKDASTAHGTEKDKA